MNILIPTDLTEESIKTLPRVVELFKGKGAKIILLHVVEPRTGGSTLVLNVDDIIYNESRDKLNRLSLELETQLATANKVDVILKSGYFQSKLNYVLEDVQPDLVVMVSKSLHGVDKILERRQTLRFIGELKQPLLIIPYDFAMDKIQTIGVGIDQKEELKADAVTKLKNIAKGLNAEMKLFHVHDFTENNLDYYENKSGQLANFEGDVALIVQDEVAVGMEEWVEKNPNSILSLVTHDKNFFTRLFSPSVTKIMAKRNSNLLLIITQ